jgi:hypothetical protein
MRASGDKALKAEVVCVVPCDVCDVMYCAVLNTVAVQSVLQRVKEGLEAGKDVRFLDWHPQDVRASLCVCVVHSHALCWSAHRSRCSTPTCS